MSNRNLIDNLSLEEKVQLTARAVAELISAGQHNAQVDEGNFKLFKEMQADYKELQNTVTRLTNTYMVVQDDLTALATRLEKLETAQFAELGDGK
jgi:hypothetical protein